MASCARIHEYVLGHHLTPHRGRILSHGCHNVLIENSRKVSNCWWLWALSVWKLFRACKNASINKHLNSYAFSVPMKAILAGCGGHTFNPSRPAKGRRISVRSAWSILRVLSRSAFHPPPPSFLYRICLVMVLCQSADFPSQFEVWAFHTMTCTFYVLEEVRNDISVAYMWNLLKRRLWGKLNLNNLSVYDLTSDLLLF